MTYAYKGTEKPEPTNRTGFTVTAHASVDETRLQRDISLTHDIAVFGRRSVDPDIRTDAGLPLKIQLQPHNFDETFQNLALPSPKVRATAGLGQLETGADGWIVRRVADFTYVICLRHVEVGAPGYRSDLPAEAQINHVEQITARYPSDLWARYAPVFANDLETWIQNNSKVARLNTIGVHWSERAPRLSSRLLDSSDEPANVLHLDTCRDAGWVKNLDFSRGAPSRIVRRDLVIQGSNAPFSAFMRCLTEKQRASASLAMGFKIRFPGVSLQLMNERHFGHIALHDRDAVLAREGLFYRAPASAQHWLDTMNWIVKSEWLANERQLALSPHSLEIAQHFVKRFNRRFGNEQLALLSTSDLKAVLILLDLATDLRLGWNVGVQELQAIHRDVIEVLMCSPAWLEDDVVRIMSQLEFTPSIIAGVLTGKNAAAVQMGLNWLGKLRQSDPSLYKSMTERMVSARPDFSMTWDEYVSLGMVGEQA